VVGLPGKAVIGIVRLYQIVVSPLLGPRCKYYPSCSAYAVAALRKHGLVKGVVLAAWRVLRCNPWSLGGVDYVPDVWPRRRAVAQPQGAR
jgi:putative membrane protein insertion efficiency factor